MTSTFPSQSFKLPDLPFDYGELEPYISAGIMDVHHKKHHQAYVNNLNVAMEKLLSAQAKGDVAAAIALQPAISFNGGGHVNHSIFWTILAPPSRGGGGQLTGDLADAINAEFGRCRLCRAVQRAVRGGAGKRLGLVGIQYGQETSARIRTRSRRTCCCSASTFGSTRITCSTRTCARTT